MVWFSTEITVHEKQGGRNFVAIDYINDQCDMSVQSETPSGVPDNIVEYVAEKFISVAPLATWNAVKSRKYKILLKDAMVELKGLGIPQDFLRQRKH